MFELLTKTVGLAEHLITKAILMFLLLINCVLIYIFLNFYNLVILKYKSIIKEWWIQKSCLYKSFFFVRPKNLLNKKKTVTIK